MKRNKSKIIIIIIAVLGITFFKGCDKNEAINTKNNTQEVKALKIAGLEHNKGLDYILKELKTSKKKHQLNTKSSDDIFTSVKNSTEKFLKIPSKIINIENSATAIEYAEYSFEWVKNNHSALNLTDSSTSHLWDSSIEESLSSKQKELLITLEEAINNVDLDLNATLKVFENVRNRADNECSEDERIAIIAAIEIGTNSMTYWDEHIDEWVNVFSSSKKWFNWKKVGGADIKGAVTGGVTGGITGAGAGIGALGGEIGASAGMAALELWNHWTK